MLLQHFWGWHIVIPFRTISKLDQMLGRAKRDARVSAWGLLEWWVHHPSVNHWMIQPINGFRNTLEAKVLTSEFSGRWKEGTKKQQFLKEKYPQSMNYFNKKQNAMDTPWSIHKSLVQLTLVEMIWNQDQPLLAGWILRSTILERNKRSRGRRGNGAPPATSGFSVSC